MKNRCIALCDNRTGRGRYLARISSESHGSVGKTPAVALELAYERWDNEDTQRTSGPPTPIDYVEVRLDRPTIRAHRHAITEAAAGLPIRWLLPDGTPAAE